MIILGIIVRDAMLNFMGYMMLLLLKYGEVEPFYKQGEWYYKPYLPQLELEHAPTMYTTESPRNLSGSDVEVMDPAITPDFRIEEPPYTRYYDKTFYEEERPYRITPHYKQFYRFNDPDLDIAGCTCCTVYKRLVPLATCAMITSKHIITTATSTELVLRRYRHYEFLQDVLGFWYDTDVNMFNSSLYAHVARIHYHPKYIRPKMVNRSHPFPAVFDLAVWTATHRFYSVFMGSSAIICPRAGSHRYEHSSAPPTLSVDKEKMALITGYQFMRAFKRKPMPWMKYMVKTKKHVYPCPKVDWGWMHCVRGNWAKLGLDSGSPIFRLLKSSWRYNGLVGINVISMRLRSLDMIHYFQVLDSHPVMDFLYDAYMGYIKKEWLDTRFNDTKGRSPAPKRDRWVYAVNYPFGAELYYGNIPNY